MKRSYFRLLVFLIAFNSANAQKNYTLKKVSKTSFVLVKNGKTIDSISCIGIKSKNTYVEVKNEIGYMFEFKVPGAGSIENSYIRIIKWKIINDKLDFEKEKYKFIFGLCGINRLKFKIKEDGIHWFYRKSLFKRLKGIITDNDIKNKKTFRLKCE